jgi:hypothetical protein
MNKIKTALISPVAVGTALLGAAPAQAHTAQDARFLDEAAKRGFGSYNGSGHLLDMAQGVCLGLDALPTSWRNIVIAVEAIQRYNPALTRDGASEFVTIAVESYCPWEFPTWTAEQEIATERNGTLSMS